jgi:hypothetical protein
MSRHWLIALLGLALAPHAAAQAPPRALSGGYSDYEEAALNAAEQSLGYARDPEPEGKPIDDIVLRRLPPIEPRDPLPTAFNVLHVESRESTLRREVVLQPAASFSRVQCDESARRLRALPQLSLVMCVALRSSRPGHVQVLILTKDVWSLFIDPDFSFDSGHLLLEPKESNLLGLHHVVFARIDLLPDQYALGGNYTIPRFDGQFVSLTGDANVAVNRETGKAEGSSGAMQAQRVPRSDRDPWSWFTDVNWQNGFIRRYSAGALLRYPPMDPTSDAPAVRIDQVYYHSDFAATAALTRSLGWRFKSDFTFAASATRVSERLPAPSPRFGKGERDARIGMEEHVLTAPHRRVGPLVEGHFYTSDFLRTYEAETLGLQEDFRLGHDVLLRVAPALQFAPPHGGFRGSEEQELVLGTSATLQETLALGNGLARAGLQASCDFGPHGAENSYGKAWLRIMTPRLGFGRFVEDAEASRVFDDSKTLPAQTYSNAGRLRGYANKTGRTAGVLNLEYRTPALELWTEQLGAVLFYDLAGVDTEGNDKLSWFDAVGVGLRLVTPLLERAGLRFDFAVPLRAADDAWMIQLAFGQAFGVPDVAPLKPKHLK